MVKLLLSTGSKRDDLPRRRKPSTSELCRAGARVRKTEKEGVARRTDVRSYARVRLPDFSLRSNRSPSISIRWILFKWHERAVSSWINQGHIEPLRCRSQFVTFDTWAFTFSYFLRKYRVIPQLSAKFTFSRWYEASSMLFDRLNATRLSAFLCMYGLLICESVGTLPNREQRKLMKLRDTSVKVLWR